MPVDAMVALSLKLKNFTDIVGKWGSVFILPLVFVTMWDVIVRKLGHMQIWLIENVGSVFGSTKIQEWEWHFHTALFALVLGYGYVNNRHVRVDLLREKMSFRNQALVEFIGCTFFMIPYCLIVGYFAFEYALDAFTSNEISASTVGLGHRWIIKSVLVIGLFVAAISGIAVWLQTVLVLFTPGSALRNSSLNEHVSETFHDIHYLVDTEGIVTDKAGSSYVVLKNIPAGKDTISVTGSGGAEQKFDWVTDTTTVFFPKPPKGELTIAYEHRFQLFTLVWPEEQAIKGARTRQV